MSWATFNPKHKDLINFMTKISNFKLNLFFLVNGNTYYNIHENSNISILNWVYNTLHNQSTTIKWLNLCSKDFYKINVNLINFKL